REHLDKIILRQMQFYGFHGLLPEENKLGQRFNVDVELNLDLRKPGQTDQMEDSIDYSMVYEVIEEIVEGEAKNLIESVAESIARSLLNTFGLLQSCQVRVVKPDPPIVGHYESIAVEVYRERNE